MTNIKYSTGNDICRRGDQDCRNKMGFNLLAEVIDENTTGTADGTLTEKQLTDFVGTDGIIDSSDIEGAIRTYAGRHPSIAQTYLPSQGEVELYLAERHPDVYQKVFKLKFNPPKEGDVNGIKQILITDILKLARIFEDGSKGKATVWAPWKFFVQAHLNGYSLHDEFNAVLLGRIGGEKNAEIAQAILKDAISKAPPLKELKGCNDANLLPCYSVVAEALRDFAQLLVIK